LVNFKRSSGGYVQIQSIIHFIFGDHVEHVFCHGEKRIIYAVSLAIYDHRFPLKHIKIILSKDQTEISS